ncbi:MAG: cytochrome c [Mariprofundales bacterium]|nr:cytochrome c [Mariprofundales bacterium]
MSRSILLAAAIVTLVLPLLAEAATGPENYRVYCMQCHGISGTGTGVNSRDMAVKPRNHTDGKYMEARSDQDLFNVIKDGGPAINKSALMPAWGDVFSDDEIRDLVKHLRKLCRCKHEK